MKKFISIAAVIGIVFAIYHWGFGSKIPVGMDKNFYSHAVQAELDIQKTRMGSNLKGYDHNGEAITWLLERVNTAALTPQEQDMYALLSRQLLDATAASTKIDKSSGADYNNIEKQVTQSLNMK
jgi:hypothetical protein